MKAFLLLRASVGGTTWLSKGGIHELKEKGRLWVGFMAFAGVLVGGAAFLMILIQNYLGLMQIGLAIGHQELLLASAMLASWVFVFFIGIPVAMSILNFSKDTRLLASLPVRDRDIVASKGLRLYLYLLPIHLLIYLPAVVITGLHTDAGVLFVVASVLQSFMGLFVPLGLAVVFVGLLTKLVNVSRWKTAIEVIGMAFGVVAAFAVQLVIVRTAAVDVSGGLSGAETSGVLSSSGMAGFFSGMLERVPPAAWSARSFLPGGGIELIASLAVFVVFVALVLLFVQQSFVADLSKRGEILRRVSAGKKPSELPESRSPLRALLSREWVIITSNSTFLFEAAGEVLIFPILLAVFAVAVPQDLVQSVLPLLESSGIGELLIFGILVLLTMINSVAATSISREGSAFALSLSLPIEPGKQVLSKLLFQLLLFFPAFAVSMTVLMILLRAPAAAALYYLPGGIGYITLMFFLGFLIDLKRPLLRWDHPQQAMKQNMNTLAAIGLGMGVAAVSAGLGYLLVQLGVSQRLTGFIVAGAAVGAAVFAGRRVSRYAGEAYHGRLEM